MRTLPSTQVPATRKIGAAILIGLALLIVSVSIFQPASAQREPARLKPPFKLIKPTNLSAPLSGVPPLPLTAPIVMSETFDSGFVKDVTYNFDVTIAPPYWHLVNANGHADTTHTWGRVTQFMTDTLWNAGTNPSGSVQLTAGQPYTKNMQAYAIYGPIDMSDFTSAFISMTYKMDTLDGDLFGAAYSTNGTDFTWLAATSGRDPSLLTNHTDYYPIPSSIMRNSQVWIALVFTSLDRNNIDALGVFIDDVVLRANPAYKIYLPVVRFDPTPTPTPTATPTATPASTSLYNYTFGTGTTSNSEFLTWGGKMNYSCGTDCTIIQDVSTNGNPSGAINFSLGGKDVIAGTAPNKTAPNNFELSADIMLVEGKGDARFGLIFGASTTTFYADGDDVKMDPSRNYYKFDLNIDPNDETAITTYRLQRYDNGSSTNLINGTPFAAGVVNNIGQWNNIRIVRNLNVASNIQIYVNGHLIISFNDATFTGAREFGVHLHSRALNNNANPLKIRFDNVIVKQLP
ncbi:MAG: hypothetical protein U0559_12470 [Anaerolineae bacterium]